MVMVWEPVSSDTVTRLSAPESLFTGPGKIGIGWSLSSRSSMNHSETGDPVRSWVYPAGVSSAIGAPFRLAAQRLATTLRLGWRQLGPDRKVVSVGRDGREQRRRVAVHVPNHVVRPDTPRGSLAGPACHSERNQLVGDGDVFSERTFHHPGQEVVPVEREWFTFRWALLLGIAHPQLQREIRRSVVLLGDREADDVSPVILVGLEPGQDGEQFGIYFLKLDRHVVPVQDGTAPLVHQRTASRVALEEPFPLLGVRREHGLNEPVRNCERALSELRMTALVQAGHPEGFPLERLSA